MDEVPKKLDLLAEKLEAIRILQAIHTEQLKEHMRRTDLLEREVKAVSEDIEPLNAHVSMVNGVLKFIGLITTIAGAIAAIRSVL